MRNFSGPTSFSGLYGFHAGVPVAHPYRVARHYRQMERRQHYHPSRRGMGMGRQGRQGRQGSQYGQESQDTTTQETQAPQAATLPAPTVESMWNQPAVMIGGAAVLAAIGYLVYRNSKKKG